jgi:protein involved in polysaccharide export with SLBB domain
MYYVLGQVLFPGPKPVSGRDTVLRALSAARPVNAAWLKRVQVVRPSADKNIKPKIFEVDFDKMTAHGDTSKNVLLEEGDIVFVPPTILAAIGMTLGELLSPVAQVASTVNVVQGPPQSR